MDVSEVERQPFKGKAEESTRPPLVPSDKNNSAVTRTKFRTTREVPSRYKDAITSPSPASFTRQCPSPNITRTVHPSSPSLPKRAQSAERSRPSMPLTPPRTSTRIDMHPTSRRIVDGRTFEGLWPSTSPVRSLSVSFQTDSQSLPFSKKERAATHTSDNTLKISANVAPMFANKPERTRTLFRGRISLDQSENAKAADNPHFHLVDQYQWPRRKSDGKMPASSFTRSMDLADKARKATPLPIPGGRTSPMRRTPISDGFGSGLRKSSSDVVNQVSHVDIGSIEYEISSTDGRSLLQSSGTHKFTSSSSGLFSSSSDRANSKFCRSRSVPTSGLARPPSPNRNPMISDTSSRGLSPLRTNSLTPFRSISTMTDRSICSSSVLSFIADVKKGKKSANRIEDVHQLRLYYNRYLQWRFVNARANASLSTQKVTAELPDFISYTAFIAVDIDWMKQKKLYTVGTTTSDLSETVRNKRINLEQQKLELKLNSLLNEQVSCFTDAFAICLHSAMINQMSFLDEWFLLERDHVNSLSGAVDALEACTIRLPVIGGARVDVLKVKDAISSTIDVIQAACDGIYSVLSKVKENSLRTYLIQLSQGLSKEQPVSVFEAPF
ncbi:hypothetical protein IFM89_026869 [Coptis chinensis]|uniref:Uncharacterized protein n=1 Tax=Coptis chinensis TaxID=261450 RepID=A0A835M1V2_9MAGN|nr:hypothetical protein IFM89_026869 [Coptis chinensis]